MDRTMTDSVVVFFKNRPNHKWHIFETDYDYSLCGIEIRTFAEQWRRPISKLSDEAICLKCRKLHIRGDEND